MSDRKRRTFGEMGGPLQRFVFPLVAKVDDEIYPVGTGFMVNPGGLFITASHVLVEANSRAVKRMGPKGFYDHYEFYAIYMNNEEVGAEPDHLFGGLVPVVNIWAPIDLDIGLGLLGLPRHAHTNAPIPTFSAILRPEISTPNEVVTAAGYSKMSGIAQKEGDVSHVQYSQETAYVTGKVVEVHPTRRDSGFLRFPCFRVDAEFDHGMSGGPIFDASGRVCGVVCSGNNWGDGSWGSLIWPIFGCQIDGSVVTAENVDKVLLYDLAKQGIVKADGSLERIIVTTLPDGRRNVQYAGGKPLS